jgi:hypothetical protein
MTTIISGWSDCILRALLPADQNFDIVGEAEDGGPFADGSFHNVMAGKLYLNPGISEKVIEGYLEGKED